jgi:hypothetical protein
MPVYELVDCALILRRDAIELQAHPHARVAPSHMRVSVDVFLRTRQTEAQEELRAGFQRTGRADRDPAAT